MSLSDRRDSGKRSRSIAAAAEVPGHSAVLRFPRRLRACGIAETLDITPPAPPERVVEDPVREIRIGLVLYGGVSLAIYIYGVVFEVWRLVRASRGIEENTYSQLLREADAWATVDITSGASAGGINGVLLAKALATGADFGAVRSLWVDGGDFATLLRSTKEPDPPSILSSDRFEQLVSDGLKAMDRSASPWPLVDVFDLFAPGTRLRPYKRVSVDELGQQIEMREYRKIFHLKFRKRGYNEADPTLGYDQNDFVPGMNKALAGVIRATSAFPAAFEPRRIVKTPDTEKLFEEGEPEDAWFSDGGILHNRPFTETLSTIFARAAERPVSRWLLSVEPDPEHFKVPPGPDVYPEVPEVVGKALMGIPRYQSIAGDLSDLAAHGQRVRRAQAFLRRVDEVAAGVDAQVLGDDPSFSELLDSQLLYKAYKPLRAQSLATTLREEILAAVAFKLPRQPESVAAGTAAFVEGLTPDATAEIDAAYELRRVYYLLERVRGARQNLAADALKRLARPQRTLWAEFDRVQQVLWSEFHDPDNVRAAALQALAGRRDADLTAAVAEALEQARAQLKTRLDEVRANTASICDDLDAEFAGSAPAPSFATVFRRYPLWDMFVLPIDDLSDAGERDLVRFIRISPEATSYIRKPAEDKLAGDTLSHFGAFAWRAWRQNDILWGRLDAAEVLTRVVLADRPADEVTAAIRSVQQQIAAEELPDMTGDYKAHLENEYRVGSEGLDVIPAKDRVAFVMDASTVSRNLMRRLGDARLANGVPVLFHWLGVGLGSVLTVFRWPVLAVWGKDTLVSRLATLVVLFLAGWAILSAVLVVVFDVADVGKRFWGLFGIALAIFAAWLVLRTWLSRKLGR